MHLVNTFTIGPRTYYRYRGQPSRSPSTVTTWMQQQVPIQRYKRTVLLDDPLYAQQWHLHGISPVTVDVEQTNLTGKGVTIGIVDDGLQHNHPEIALNYDPLHSHNYNDGPANDPSPRSSRDGHGTSAAGVAVARKGNGHCGRGVAPEAKVAGIRLIAGPVTDYTESQALGGPLPIYSNSWGPADTGEGIDGPGRLVRETFAYMAGDMAGRGGKGTVYVWASGNGRDRDDSCNFDGYANNPYVNAIGAVDVTGAQAWYSEGCAALMAVAPSSGSMFGITTADLLGPAGYSAGECTGTFGGTSSAAPLAAGIIALLLQARPDLTWRDVKHVLAKGATPLCPDNQRHCNEFGFGLLRVAPLVAAARAHELVPLMVQLTSTVRLQDQSVPCTAQVAVNQSLAFVETVALTVALRHPRRGALTILLTSPNGITSLLASPRPNDTHSDYPTGGWTFSSVHHWSERLTVNATWTVTLDGPPGGGVDWLKLVVTGY